MKKELFLAGVLILVLFSGCAKPETECSNDALKVVEYNIYPEEVRPEGTATITFWIVNRGGTKAEDVRVKFFDTQGFEPLEVSCGEGSGKDSCAIESIQSFGECKGEKKKVTARLKAPDTPGLRTVSFSLDYKYSGLSKFLFTIWDNEELENDWGETQKVMTDGPIKVDIDPGFLFKRKLDMEGKTIVEWVEEGHEFPLRVSIRDETDPRSILSEANIEYFKVLFDHVFPDPDSENCGLKLEAYSKYYISSVEPAMDTSIECDMKVDEIDQNFVTGDIEVEYKYRYKTVEQQDLYVRNVR
ncbi:MAG: hypothetical protein ISS48_04445 [Candidatus Aenigmarchaeota archaeon]|nr:hypothetical protein [Candidatus Aenigmarchaeota archaeon]